MALKLFRAVWFLSLLGALANLLFTYAYLPENVAVYERGATLTQVPRDAFFYIAVAVMTLVNVLVYIVSRVYKKDEAFRSWFYGLIVTLNVFLIVTLSLLSTYNSGEHFRYSNIDFIIYGSVWLIVLWAVAWPVYFLYRKFSTKQTV